jgi:hypothetical protein
VTIGEALAEARNKAGLSIDEVSERTRIRETVIRGIEQDNYDACGGDLYIRGYVRVIANVVGIDAQPLIREYDLAHTDNPEPPTLIDLIAPGLKPDESAEPIEPTEAEPAVPEPTVPEPAEPEPATPVEAAEPESAEPESATPEMITPELVASEPLTPQPQLPLVTAASRPSSAPGSRPRPRRQEPRRQEPRRRPRSPNRPAQAQPAWKARKHSRRWAAGITALVVVVLAAVGFAGGHIVSSLRGSAKTTAASSPAAGRRGASASPGSAKGKPSAAARGNGTKPATSPATTPKATPTPTPAVTPSSGPLPVALAEAFGPAGVTDGDNPQGALAPITPGASSPWQTDWYTTPNFGRLKQGTGLLLDLGSRATITGVRVTLGPAAGADLQLLAGDTPALADLSVVASASDVGGTVSPRLAHAVRAQYVLIWFTQLPPNGAGKYQASVYQVLVSGQP